MASQTSDVVELADLGAAPPPDAGSDDRDSQASGSTAVDQSQHNDEHETEQRAGPDTSAGTQSTRASGRKGGQRRTGGGQRRTHMASFVSFDHHCRGRDDVGDEAPERSPVDAAGVRRVLEYERSCGRFPEEQAHNNPGYDVLAKDGGGTVRRRIEIKSIGGPWTGFGVWMPATQLDENRTHPDDFWLYVVENADDDDAAVIHRIHNPAGEATKFGFGNGWQALREPDIERDEAGQALLGSTRRLLGWGRP